MAKQNPKYVKKIPKPGGGYYYIYPDQIKQQWDSFKQNAKQKVNKAKQNAKEFKQDVADVSGYTDRQFMKKQQALVDKKRANLMLNNRGSFKPSKQAKSELHNEMQFLKLAEDNYYNRSPLGKAEKAAKKTGAAAKKAGKAVVAKSADAIGLDERKEYKESKNSISKTVNKLKYDKTVAGKVEKTGRKADEKISEFKRTAADSLNEAKKKYEKTKKKAKKKVKKALNKLNK